ncbi:MAG TPA: DUF1697 domain-containing protein, partial [Gemmataceae bacterium]|nr:DUF1697 domain-containing protein [Gemmataceae bacterium]
MPTTQIALIRGINVGRAKRIAMAELRALFEDLGFADVRTLLNSGNVVFTTSRAAAGDGARIEEALADRLHVSARVMVISAVRLARVVATNPLLSVANDPSRLLVAFLARPTDRKKLEPLCKQDWENEALALGDGAAYIWCAAGILESRLLRAVGRVVGDGM